MAKYIFKRIGLMLVTFFIVTLMCFVLIKLLPDPIVCTPTSAGGNCDAMYAWYNAMGYNKPIMEQFWIYLQHICVGDFGIGTKMYPMQSVGEIMSQKLPATISVNLWTMIIGIPLGLILGTFSALKKNKWEDSVISVLVMLVISVPSYVYCFIIMYFFCFKWNWFPITINNGTNFFTPQMVASMMPAIICMVLGTIAGLTRYSRAELTEVLTSEYMLLARAKGLTRAQATVRHAFRNAMVPIFPMILGEIIGLLSGSLIVENFFGIPGVGALYITSINVKDYNFFMFLNMFYIAIGLVSGLIIDLSYGFIDPRIRMGAK